MVNIPLQDRHHYIHPLSPDAAIATQQSASLQCPNLWNLLPIVYHCATPARSVLQPASELTWSSDSGILRWSVNERD